MYIGPCIAHIRENVKIIEELNSRLNGNSSAFGTVNLFSERPVCASCDNVIKAFSADYPNLTINVFDFEGNMAMIVNGQLTGQTRRY
ncbi:deaminase domain-containing protein [Paenibacillus qinlingensis]|uniref:deaminase domain-containing protein n=1 Tax=Paenibacillus qinlingensis TaxID=1837343 RepID=UPI0037CB251F